MNAIPNRASHIVEHDDLRAWLAGHGLDIRDVREATIRVDRGYRDHIGAWLDATWYKRNDEGSRYRDPRDGDQAACGHSSIPLASFPKLTPVLDGAEP